MTDPRKQQTKKAIEKAMADLLKDHSFNEVTTVKLAQTARISRSSFYTHYKDKYEMIEAYQQRMFANIEYIFDKHKLDKEAIILEVFDYLNREDLFAALLSQNGTREIQIFLRHKLRLLLSHDLQNRFSKEEKTAIEDLYTSVYLSHAIFGACQTWIARGKKESPAEMTQLLLKLLGK
ncbi:TetR/AcrR family transcriptional regulator [Streptococcus cuniculipharyngis]|uniref:TetR family transcriptional regulator n=1 Tax=Streptococcus cuniculipharyngis TaxID=1562651 RepID=A0A5C5S9T1_9STRE|nr:TetR/AcrR family transcriptional regulator [Streptococcus cuniculipharyngis]TWS96272.1 TetR family transcriptional regulator [Streptococcus cuniculipharyngis]